MGLLVAFSIAGAVGYGVYYIANKLSEVSGSKKGSSLDLQFVDKIESEKVRAKTLVAGKFYLSQEINATIKIRNGNPDSMEKTLNHELGHTIMSSMMYQCKDIVTNVQIQEVVARVFESIVDDYSEDELHDMPSSEMQNLILDTIDSIFDDEPLAELLKEDYNVEYPTQTEGRLIVNIIVLMCRTLKYNTVWQTYKESFRDALGD